MTPGNQSYGTRYKVIQLALDAFRASNGACSVRVYLFLWPPLRRGERKASSRIHLAFETRDRSVTYRDAPVA